MRSVKAERMPRGPRGAASARTPRGGVRTPMPKVAPKVVPAKSGITRLAPPSRPRRFFIFRRPMLVLTFSFIALAVVAALIVGGAIGRTMKAIGGPIGAIVADAGFGITEIHLAGNARTPPQAILKALGFAPGQSIFGADLHAARERLMKLDWVADAEVRRRYPDAISVRLVEKLPFALWKSPQGVYVVERAGGTITNEDVGQFVHLPLIVGQGAPTGAAELIDTVALHRVVAARVRAYERVSDRRWNLILDDGVTVKLPEIGWQKELDTLDHLVVDKGILERNLSEIDLRSPTHFFFVLKSGQTKNIDRGSEL